CPDVEGAVVQGAVHHVLDDRALVEKRPFVRAQSADRIVGAVHAGEKHSLTVDLEGELLTVFQLVLSADLSELDRVVLGPALPRRTRHRPASSPSVRPRPLISCPPAEFGRWLP